MAGEYVNHYTGIRLRVTGVGNLKCKFLSLSETLEYDMVPLVMFPQTNRQADRLANFNQERATLLIETTEFDEHFRIEKLMVFIKIVGTGYPG